MQEIILGGGCFWCLEASFQILNGVSKVQSGYAGGTKETANYKQVCSGKTQHAEVVKITYDPDIISLEELLNIFWNVHDPTTINRQGNDVGPQYRSVIYYANPEERIIIDQSISLENENIGNHKIVTEVKQLSEFFPAELEHENYFLKVGDRNPYCTYVVKPKVVKINEKFKDKIKSPS